MRIWLYVMVGFLIVPACVGAQCDTSAVNRAVKQVEDNTWADYPRVLVLANDLVEKYRGEGGYCEARSLLAKARTLWTNGEYAESIRLLRISVQLSVASGDGETLARSYLVLANNYYYQAYYDSAEANFLRCLNGFVTLHHRTGQIEVLHDMALMYHRRGQYAASVKALLESEQLKELEPDFVHLVGDFSRGNTFFIDTLYYRNAVIKEKELLAKFRKRGNQIGIYQSLINISIAYHELADFRRAGYFAALGSSAMKSFGHYPFWYLAGKEYGLAGIKDSCFYFHTLAMAELPRATQIKVVTTYEQIGNSFMQFRQPDSALVYFEKALLLNKRMNNRITVPGIHLSLAQAYSMKGSLRDADSHLHEGLSLARGVSVLHERNLNEFGMELYEQLGQPIIALSYARRHDELEDSINGNEDAMVMIRYQTQFEMERKERELEGARLVLRSRTITLVSLAAFTLLSVGFVGMLYFQRRQIQRQNVLLEESNAEQKALTQEVHHRVKNNLQYIVSLLSLQSQNVDSPELVQQIEEIKTRIMTMGIIHQRLYQVQGIQAVYLPTFLQELLDNLMRVLSSRVPVGKQLSIDPVRIDVESAIALGLLVNELATNAVKHAFGNHPAPNFTLHVARSTEGLHIKVSDNGPGYNLQLATGRGFGIRLMGLLLRKLKGTMVQVDPNTVEVKISGIQIIG